MRVRLNAMLLLLGAALLLGTAPATAEQAASSAPAVATIDAPAQAVDRADVDQDATLEVDPFYGQADFSAVAKGGGGCQFCKQKYPCSSSGTICNDMGCTCRICAGNLRCAR